MNQVTVFAADSAALTFTDKKGVIHGITPEGAIYKGGAALASLKEATLDSALSKSVNGRYRAAADILGACFPKAAKCAAGVLGATPAWQNKMTMSVLLAACQNTAAPEKGWSKKQAEARILLGALLGLEAFAVKAAETVEA